MNQKLSRLIQQYVIADVTVKDERIIPHVPSTKVKYNPKKFIKQEYKKLSLLERCLYIQKMKDRIKLCNLKNGK